jgi:tRNA A-37 threonylcarbamoyl transferase component Bud32
MAQQVLNERYKVETTLGEGGMARVYRGTDQVLDRTVAIKVLADRYAEDDNFVTRFRREAQAAAALSHPNVVAVFDTGDDDAAHYIVMEYVEGRTLGEVLKVQGPFDADRASAITEDVATALQAAHERGLVHRDVKPGNVMIDTEGRVKVMDFGIARAAANDTLTQTGTVLGTAAYLSPEQARGDSVDARSDIYSLGCVLFEMVAGRPPFTGDSPVSLAFRHVNEDPQPPSVYRPGVPPQLEAVVMRALEKDPGQRYQSAEEFRRALADFRGDGAATVPIGAPAPGGDTAVMPTAAGTAADGAPPRPGPRVPWLPLGLLVAAILVLAGFLALTQVAERDGGDRQGERRQGQGGEEQQPEPADEVPSPQMALAAFDDFLTSAVSEGAVTPEAAETIANKVDEAGMKYLEGDLDKALEELGKAKEEIDKAAESGQISSGDVADALHQGIDLISASMEAAPPEVPTEGDAEDEGEGEEESSGEGNGEGNGGGNGDEGEGNGEGKGKGKGKGKDD